MLVSSTVILFWSRCPRMGSDLAFGEARPPSGHSSARGNAHNTRYDHGDRHGDHPRASYSLRSDHHLHAGDIATHTPSSTPVLESARGASSLLTPSGPYASHGDAGLHPLGPRSCLSPEFRYRECPPHPAASHPEDLGPPCRLPLPASWSRDSSTSFTPVTFSVFPQSSCHLHCIATASE